MFNDNRLLGEFILDGIPPSPRGVPQVEVTFDVDANGILNVKAIEKTTNKEQSIRIEASSNLSEEDIDKMQKEAELHADDDKQKEELITAKNTADQLVYTSEKALKDNGDKIEESLKTSIEDKIKVLKEKRDGDDLDVIQEASEDLSVEIQKIGEAMAQQAQESAAEGEDGESKVTDVEAEEESKDDSKGDSEDKEES